MGGLSSFFGGGSSSQSPSSVWGVQSPYLQGLYSGIYGLAGQQLGGAAMGYGGLPAQTPQQGFIPAGARPAYGSRAGQGYVQNGRYVAFNSPNAAKAPVQPAGPTTQPVPAGPTTQQAGGYSGVPATNPLQTASQQQVQNLFGWLGQGSPALQNQINAYGQNLGNFFNQQVLPGINQQASYYGGTGGSRQSLAQGLAAQGILNQYQQGVTGLQAADYAQNLANIGNLYNLGMAPYQAAWQPLSNLSQLLGGPAILGGGGQSSGPGLGNSLLSGAVGGWTQPFGLFG